MIESEEKNFIQATVEASKESLTNLVLPPHDFYRNFDLINRPYPIDSVRYNRAVEGIIDLALGEMDFNFPEQIKIAIVSRLMDERALYAKASEMHETVIQNMLKNAHQWDVKNKSDIVFLSNLIPALRKLAQLVTSWGGSLIVPTPCYPPFVDKTKEEAHVIQSPLLLTEKGWQLDFNDLDRAVKSGGKMLLFCNPHNPTGHVFEPAELIELGKWAEDRNVVIASDEIHCGLILNENKRHYPIAQLENGRFADRTITLMSPTKTFNIPGFGNAFAIISNNELRFPFEQISKDGEAKPTIIGLAANQSAYQECAQWHQDLLKYLKINLEVACRELRPYSDLIQFSKPAGTYFLWLNCHATGWRDPQKIMQNFGKISLGNGASFQAPGHLRLTFATSRMYLEESLRRITGVLDEKRAGKNFDL